MSPCSLLRLHFCLSLLLSLPTPTPAPLILLSSATTPFPFADKTGDDPANGSGLAKGFPGPQGQRWSLFCECPVPQWVRMVDVGWSSWRTPADGSLGSGCTGQRPQPHLRLFPQLPSPDELPANVKQAYRAFAAVPTVHPPEDNGTQVCAVVPCCCSCMLSLGWVPRVSAPKRNTSQV